MIIIVVAIILVVVAINIVVITTTTIIININTQQLTCFSNVALSMTEGPDDGVNDQLELVWRHGEEGAKTVVGDGSQQAVEM